MQPVNEIVTVEAGFGAAKVAPLWFVWRGRKYDVLRVTMTFERRDGGRRYLCFAVDTGGMTAELVMDRENLQWRLTRCVPSYI